VKEEETTDRSQRADNAVGSDNDTSAVENFAEVMAQATTSTAEGPVDVVIRILDRGLHVSDEFYRVLVGRAQDRIPRLNFEEAYRAQDVFGHDYWNTLRNRERWLAGKVLAHQVASKQLRLKFVSCQYCTIQRYQRI
jgi:hypothetical protein